MKKGVEGRNFVYVEEPCTTTEMVREMENGYVHMDCMYAIGRITKQNPLPNADRLVTYENGKCIPILEKITVSIPWKIEKHINGSDVSYIEHLVAKERWENLSEEEQDKEEIKEWMKDIAMYREHAHTNIGIRIRAEVAGTHPSMVYGKTVAIRRSERTRQKNLELFARGEKVSGGIQSFSKETHGYIKKKNQLKHDKKYKRGKFQDISNTLPGEQKLALRKMIEHELSQCETSTEVKHINLVLENVVSLYTRQNRKHKAQTFHAKKMKILEKVSKTGKNLPVAEAIALYDIWEDIENDCATVEDLIAMETELDDILIRLHTAQINRETKSLGNKEKRLTEVDKKLLLLFDRQEEKNKRLYERHMQKPRKVSYITDGSVKERINTTI